MLKCSFFGLCFRNSTHYRSYFDQQLPPFIFFSEIVSYICDIVTNVLVYSTFHSWTPPNSLHDCLKCVHALTSLCAVKFSDFWQMCHIHRRIVSPSYIFPVSPVNLPSHFTECLTMTDIFIVCINFTFSRMAYYWNHWSFVRLIFHLALCI